jgi:hypothetical protein
MRSVPHAAANAETAIIATEMRRTLIGRLMRGEIIRNNRTSMPRPRTATLLFAASLAAAVAGCGGTTVSDSSHVLRVGLTEYRLSPQSVSVGAGALTIVAHNYGRLTHNVVVFLDGHSQGSTPPIAPGQTADLTVILSKGRYAIASTVQSDQALGVYGTLTVR